MWNCNIFRKVDGIGNNHILVNQIQIDKTNPLVQRDDD